MMAHHQIRKTYTAIVFGWPIEETFVVNQPLLRQGLVRPSKIYLKQTVHPDGSPALTSFHVLNRFVHRDRPFALVEAEPETGRTHQIRVHLAHAGYPIVGDKIYGPDENCYLEFIETETYDVSLYVKNLGDDRTIIQRPEINTVVEGYTVRPLTVGLTGTIRFNP